MNTWIDDISLLTEDFFAGFRGSLYETPSQAGGIYRITTGTWTIRDTAGCGKPSYSQNLYRYLAQAGNVRFQAIGSNHDLFYCQEVRVTGHDLLWEEPFVFQCFTFGQGEFWIDGAKPAIPGIGVALCNPIIFGIYEDDHNRILKRPSGYEVTIYIHYET